MLYSMQEMEEEIYWSVHEAIPETAKVCVMHKKWKSGIFVNSWDDDW